MAVTTDIHRQNLRLLFQNPQNGSKDRAGAAGYFETDTILRILSQIDRPKTSWAPPVCCRKTAPETRETAKHEYGHTCCDPGGQTLPQPTPSDRQPQFA